jgi:hypothetical protein
VTSLDLATASSVAKPWYGRLEELAWQNQVRGGRAPGRGGRPVGGLLRGARAGRQQAVQDGQ